MFATSVTVSIPNATATNTFHATCPTKTPHATSTGCQWDPSPLVGVSSNAFGTNSLSLYALVQPLDASAPVEAGPPDAPVDAPIDAPVDATPPNTVSGTVDGISVPTQYTTGFTATMPDGEDAGGMVALAGFAFSDTTSFCTSLETDGGFGGFAPGETFFGIIVAATGVSVGPGMYPVTTDVKSPAQAFLYHLDAACNFTPPLTSDGGVSASGTSGYVEFASVSLTNLSGSFDVTFDGEELKGTFDVPICPAPAPFGSAAPCVPSATNCCAM
jgi:hypothetical protein